MFMMWIILTLCPPLTLRQPFQAEKKEKEKVGQPSTHPVETICGTAAFMLQSQLCTMKYPPKRIKQIETSFTTILVESEYVPLFQ